MIRITFLFAILLVVLKTNAQSDYLHINSIDSIAKGIEFHDNGEYEKAIALYSMVEEGDTNHMLALSEMTLSLYSLEKYDTVLSISNEMLKTPWYAHNGTYAQIGSSYDVLGEVDSAIAAYNKGLELYPLDANLYFNLALTYQSNDDLDNAVINYKKALEINPFHHSSNLNLGLICAEENELAMAMMCLDMFLVLEPNSSRSLSVLSTINEMLAENYKGDPQNVKLRDAKNDDDFADINLIIKNRIALNKSFKTPNKLNIPFVKQNYALMTSLENKKGTGFWFEYYVPFFQKVMAEKKFNDMMYYMMISSSNQSISNVLNKNIKEINNFPSWAGPLWLKLHQKIKWDFNGKTQYVDALRENSVIYALGELNGEQKTGLWEYYYSTGMLASTGNFKNNEKDGEWKYFFDTGSLSGTGSSIEGKADGKIVNYHPNGVIKNYYHYTEGKINGISESFYANTAPKSKLNYQNSLLEDRALYFYNIGQVEYDVNYKENKLNGEFKEYFETSQLFSASQFVDDKREGEEITYYRSGQVRSKFIKKEGKNDGPYSFFYQNGQLSEKGTYAKGLQVGEYQKFYRSGVLQEEGSFDDEGKQVGSQKLYQRNGKLGLELNFKKGEIISYINYNIDGDIVSSAKKSGGEFLFESYYFNGNLHVKGNYQVGDGGQDGKWFYYDENGTLSSTSMYNYGKLDGKNIYYYKNGNPSSIRNYLDGKSQGYSASYFINEAIESEVWYDDDKLNGLGYSYLIDGTLLKKYFYVNNKYNGPVAYYYIDGTLQKIAEYDMGVHKSTRIFDLNGNIIEEVKVDPSMTEIVLKDFQGNLERKCELKYGFYHGKAEYFYSNGQQSSSGYFFKGNQDSSWTYFYRDGTISSFGDFQNGDKIGRWQSFFENGSIKSDLSYNANGEVEGDYLSYYDNGELKFKGNYANGTIQDSAFYYSPEGILQQIRFYDLNGILIGYTYKDANGAFVKTIPVKDETVEMISYYPNGKVARKQIFDKGMLESDYLIYYENGTLFERNQNKNNKDHGLVERYYPNGKLKEETPYEFDYINGTQKKYYENGNLRLERNYRYDELHGETRYYNSDGSLAKTENYFSGIQIIDQ